MMPQVSFVIVLLVVCLSLPARADDKSALAREHFDNGTVAFHLGNYDEAAVEYTAAYRLKNDPALLYNIAQAHRLAGHAAEALHFYKIFLEKPHVPNRDAVLVRVAELENLIARQKRAQGLRSQTVNQPEESAHSDQESPHPMEAIPAPAFAETTGAKTDAPIPAKAPEVAPPATATQVSSNGHKAGRTKEIIGLSVAAVGIAALASGVALAVVAKKASDDLSATARNGGFWNQDKSNSGNTYNTVGMTLIGVGAAAAVAGTVVAILGIREHKKAASVAIIPVANSNLAALQLQAHF